MRGGATTIRRLNLCSRQAAASRLATRAANRALASSCGSCGGCIAERRLSQLEKLRPGRSLLRSREKPWVSAAYSPNSGTAVSGPSRPAAAQDYGGAQTPTRSQVFGQAGGRQEERRLGDECER